jgi:membrane dipeptidase
MLIIDAHLDLAWNALQWNRNIQHSVYTIRTGEKSVTGTGRGQGTVALPEMRRGRVALCFGTLLARSTGRTIQNLDYSSPYQAYAAAQGQLAYYRALHEAGEVRLIMNRADLDDHLSTWLHWETDVSHPQPKIGLMISMESADPILVPEQLPAWKELGVRIIGPAHYGPGRYAGGTSTELGLGFEGKQLLREMDTLGILLDLTHFSDEAFWEAMDSFGGPVLASHSNCRSLVPHQRQLDDRQIRAILSRDGVIGIALDNWMLRPGWTRGAKDNERITLAHVADHMDHICQLAGNSRHAALGSDLDGGFGREQSPADLDTIADLQHIPEVLAKRGYSDADIAFVMHGNWLRLLRAAWK